jgi:hypothetical protein
MDEIGFSFALDTAAASKVKSDSFGVLISSISTELGPPLKVICFEAWLVVSPSLS